MMSFAKFATLFLIVAIFSSGWASVLDHTGIERSETGLNQRAPVISDDFADAIAERELDFDDLDGDIDSLEDDEDLSNVVERMETPESIRSIKKRIHRRGYGKGRGFGKGRGKFGRGRGKFGRGRGRFGRGHGKFGKGRGKFGRGRGKFGKARRFRGGKFRKGGRRHY